MPNALELAIYRTLAYFAYFKYPLTSFEVWKWLLQPETQALLVEVIQTLESSAWLQTRVQSEGGFYALGEVGVWRHNRHLRFLDAMRKYRKVERAVRLLGRLPWIDGIAVCNSLAWYHTTAESDIDVFIVASPGRLWSARLLATLPAMLLRQRPGELKLDPICLSFFCTPRALDFEKLKISQSDPYLAYWSRSLVALTDRVGWTVKFEMDNPWLQAVLPNAKFVRRAHRFRSNLRFRLPWLPLSEKLPKQIQLDKFTPAIRELMNKDTRVIVTDDMLKFHDIDRRAEINVWVQDYVSKV